MRQIADARHVFARFVDVRLAKLFVECGNLVVGMSMVVTDFLGRLRQGAVGQTGDCGQFVTVSLRTGKADVGMRFPVTAFEMRASSSGDFCRGRGRFPRYTQSVCRIGVHR